MSANTSRKHVFQRNRFAAGIVTVAWILFLLILGALPQESLPAFPEFWRSFAHFMAYWLLAIFLIGALDAPWRKSWMVAIAAMVIASLFGIVDELHQSLAFGRMGSVTDWLVDTGGGTLGSLVGTWCLTMFRLWRTKRADTSAASADDDKTADDGNADHDEGSKHLISS